MTDDDGTTQERLPDHHADPAGHQHHSLPHEEDDESTVSLKLEQLILDAARKYTPYQAARTAGVPMELASRFWRAMGFPDIGQSRALTDADVIALRRLAGLVESGLLSESMAIQVARSTGQTTARLAEWQMDTFLENLTQSIEPGLSRADVAYPLVQLLLPELEEFLVYVWRRQLAAVTGRVVQAAEDEEVTSGRLAVGFADLVGFTRLSRRLEEEELGELVETFESTCADLVAGHGGRLIKTLGDEVLYVSDDPAVAAELGLALVETLTKDDSMPALRVGMAFGTVTSRMGDVFGTTVNLASRLTSIAPKDAVLIDGEFAAALEREGAVPPSAGPVAPSPGVADALSAVAAGVAPGGPVPAVEQATLPTYRFHLQPMWRRPVRGLGLVEPWLLTRRAEHI
ncbi:adenylate/guanylate cyclase domain-containing protein [Peterkaempfera griseoplana]|uniref:adenylate/guanylate cyclase domain-containing protein n=1 Tax=Peterkaempfera griseoplana TaxID=66896 RepID=UPI00099F0783|nr:adenylate/guanylate cyclase domain-containing protein [Peterkaempfera griseoplana]